MQHASPRTSSWASLQQAEAQTAGNETESKTQTLNTQSSSLKVVRQTYLSSADAARELKIEFISIYVDKCKLKRFNKSDIWSEKSMKWPGPGFPIKIDLST